MLVSGNSDLAVLSYFAQQSSHSTQSLILVLKRNKVGTMPLPSYCVSKLLARQVSLNMGEQFFVKVFALTL